jgi:hypothetical protein
MNYSEPIRAKGHYRDRPIPIIRQVKSNGLARRLVIEKESDGPGNSDDLLKYLDRSLGEFPPHFWLDNLTIIQLPTKDVLLRQIVLQQPTRKGI